MPDPIDELEHFTIPGAPVHPLPAAEVRRRGDRLRRRNNALVAAGCLAVVAAIAAPLATLAGNQQSSAPQPANPTPSHATQWRQTVPASFDLTAVPSGATVRYTARPDSVVDDLSLCGASVFSTRSGDPVGPASDTAGAVFGEAGTESSSGRTLAVFADDAAASAALDAVRTGVAQCPEDDNGRGAPLVHSPVEGDVPGAEESFVFAQQSRMDADLLADLTVFEMARVGNALYLGTLHTSAGGTEVVADTAGLLADLSAPVVGQMCAFSSQGCGEAPAPGPSSASTPDPSAGTGEGAVSAIPADFPIDRGLAAPEGDPIDGPSPTATGAPALSLCGTELWPVAGVERLAATATGPEYQDSRELVTFARVADLVTVLDDLRAAVASCPSTPAEGGGTQDVAAYDVALGEDAVTLSVLYHEGLGGGIYQFVQVGRGLLVTYRAGEFSPDTVDAGVQETTRLTNRIVPAMCVFSETGC